MGALTKNVNALVQTQPRFIRRPGLATDLLVGVAPPVTVNLFRITGGMVALEGFAGRVTTVIGAIGATTLALTLTGAIGGIVTPMCVASAAIANNQVETVYTITGAVGVGMTIQTGAARGVGVYQLTNKQVLVPGIIGLVVAVSENTGVIEWVLSYTPLHPAAHVAIL